MRLHERPYGDTIVVDIEGPVDRESGAMTELVVSVKRLIARGYKVIVLNVAELDSIDSVLLGAIAQSHTSAIRAGSALKLVNVPERLKELLAMTKLNRFIQTIESEDEELEG
jgi:anti-sigma B factor antagonist